jgi:hypothetical protein
MAFLAQLWSNFMDTVERDGGICFCFLLSNILRFSNVNLIVFFAEQDPRLKQWLMMSDPLLSTSICAAYFIFVMVGSKLMKNREPFELRGLLIVYNFCMVLVSLYLFSEVSLFCEPFEKTMIRFSWLFRKEILN